MAGFGHTTNAQAHPGLVGAMKISDITCTPPAIGKGLLRIATDAEVEGWEEVPGGKNAGVQGVPPPARTSTRPSSPGISTMWPTCSARTCCPRMVPSNSATGSASALNSTKPRSPA